MNKIYLVALVALLSLGLVTSAAYARGSNQSREHDHLMRILTQRFARTLGRRQLRS